jgi:hypothetical protein
MRTASLFLLALIGLAGCEPIATDTSPPVPSTAAPATNDNAVGTNSPATPTDPVTLTPPDNTAINERDASGATKTPIDQDENSPDVKTTAEIRKRITATEGLSINAQNAKVITSGGKVTLRGPVESAAERDTIDRIARDVAGEANVDNQLEVAN